MAQNRLRRVAAGFLGALSGPSRRDMELNYLNESISLADLERRMAEVDRGKFRNW